MEPVKKQRISKHIKHPLFNILSAYRPETVAQSIQCSLSYYQAVLYGHRVPSKAIEQRLQQLATSLSQEVKND